MRYLGFDLGTKTLGISISDKTNTIASSLKTIRFSNVDDIINDIKQIIDENSITCIILGLPKNMNNTIGEASNRTIIFKEKLGSILNIEIIFEDERMTSVIANNLMISDNVSRKKRKQKVDAIAATIILQQYLDRRKG